jgi:hypothetical protein
MPMQRHYTILVIFDPLFYHAPESPVNDTTWFAADLPEKDVEDLLVNPDLDRMIEDWSEHNKDSAIPVGMKRVYLCEAVSLFIYSLWNFSSVIFSSYT